jgi:hypothetical protein
MYCVECVEDAGGMHIPEPGIIYNAVSNTESDESNVTSDKNTFAEYSDDYQDILKR